MARMFTNSIYYVHEKSAMAALSDNIPVIHPKGNLKIEKGGIIFVILKPSILMMILRNATSSTS
jgi:hypothetical protein